MLRRTAPVLHCTLRALSGRRQAPPVHSLGPGGSGWVRRWSRPSRQMAPLQHIWSLVGGCVRGEPTGQPGLLGHQWIGDGQSILKHP